MDELELKIKIKFTNKNLLQQALTHRSYLNENKGKTKQSNERLEFLGDAVLELWVTEKLYRNFPNLYEGILTNIRASLVCTESLSKIARKLSLGKYLFLSRGEDKGGGRDNNSILADAFEALVGAIFLDQGWEKTDWFLKKILLADTIKLGKNGDIKDAKTKLQEIVQAKTKITPHYKILKEEGPDHEKTFTCAVYFKEKRIATGVGSSKKESEENAAQKALTKISKRVKI